MSSSDEEYENAISMNEESNLKEWDMAGFSKPVDVKMSLLAKIPNSTFLILFQGLPFCEFLRRFAKFMASETEERTFFIDDLNRERMPRSFDKFLEEIRKHPGKKSAVITMVQPNVDLLVRANCIIYFGASFSYYQDVSSKTRREFDWNYYIMESSFFLSFLSFHFKLVSTKIEMLLIEEVVRKGLPKVFENVLKRLYKPKTTGKAKKHIINELARINHLKFLHYNPTNFKSKNFYGLVSSTLRPIVDALICLDPRSTKDLEFCTSLVRELDLEFNLFDEVKRYAITYFLRAEEQIATKLCKFLERLLSYSRKIDGKNDTLEEMQKLNTKIGLSASLLCITRLCRIIEDLCFSDQLDIELFSKTEFATCLVALMDHPSPVVKIQGHLFTYLALSRRQKTFRQTLKSLEALLLVPYEKLYGETLLRSFAKLTSPLKEKKASSTACAEFIDILNRHHVLNLSEYFPPGYKESLVVTWQLIEYCIEIVRALVEDFKDFESGGILFGFLASLLHSSVIDKEILFESGELLFRLCFKNLKYFFQEKLFLNSYKYTLDFFNCLLLKVSNSTLFNLKNSLTKVKHFPMVRKSNKDYFNQAGPSSGEDKFISDFVYVWNKLEATPAEEEKNLSSVTEIWKMKIVLQIERNKNIQIEKENKDLKEKMERMEKAAEESEEEIKRLESRVIELSTRIAELEQQASAPEYASRKPGGASESENRKEACSYSEEKDELLKIEIREEISKKKAKAFVNNLRKTRENIVELRSSICGALKFLGSKLYSSSTHFFYEMIQNADDNHYAKASAKPTLLFLLDESYILICNNEYGFLPKNVAAVCQIGKSSKKAGFAIGRKGLGFKSIFSCSNCPYVVSEPWRFCFRVDPERDELKYITPYWVDELPYAVSQAPKGFQTKIYLPFKENFSKEKRDFILKDILDSFDGNILLNLRNLSEIAVSARTQTKTIRCLPKSLPERLSDRRIKEIDFKNIEKKVATLERVFKEEQTAQDFIVYSAEVEVPLYLKVSKEDFETESNTTKISLAFPLLKSFAGECEKAKASKQEEGGENDDMSKFCVYAFLPLIKENYGFRFILNCDWMLTTNRESIRENEWNSFLRDCAAKFMFLLISEDEYINCNIAHFLPRATSKHWWNRFRNIIVEGLSDIEYLLKTLKVDTSKSLLIFNQLFRDLVTAEEIQKALPQIALIHLEKLGLDESSIRNNSIKKFGLSDLLQMLNGSSGFLISRSDDWWRKFYSLLNQEKLKGDFGLEFITFLLASPIFLIRNSSRRTTLPRSALGYRFIMLGRENYIDEISWRAEELAILSAGSLQEREFLKVDLNIPEISLNSLFKTLSTLHELLLFQRKEPEELEQEQEDALLSEKIWKDLAFLKSHNLQFLSFVQTGCLLPFAVPTINESAPFVELKRGVFPRVLLNKVEIGDIGELKMGDEIVECTALEKESPQGLLSWTLFLYQIGVKPVAHLFNNSKYILESLSLFEEGSECCSLAMRIMEKRPIIQKIASNMSIFSIKNELTQFNLAADEILGEEIGLPIVKIPAGSRKFFKRLDVKMKADLNLTINALKYLISQNQASNRSRFIFWLGKLLIYEDEWDKDLEKKSDLKGFLKLPISTSFKDLSKVYIFEDKQREEIARKAKKLLPEKWDFELISETENTDLAKFIPILKQLGCPTDLTMDYFTHILEPLESNEANYNMECDLSRTTLSEVGFNEYLGLFKILDNFIEIKAKVHHPDLRTFSADMSLEEEWACRKELLKKVRAVKQHLNKTQEALGLPFITVSKEIIHRDFHAGPELPIAYINSYLEEFAQETESKLLLLHPEIARKFPYIVAYMGLEYLEEKTAIYNNPVPEKNPFFRIKLLEEELKKLLNIEKDEIFIIKSLFFAVGLNISLGEEINEFQPNFKNFLVLRNCVYLVDVKYDICKKTLRKALALFIKQFRGVNVEKPRLKKLVEDFFAKNQNNSYVFEPFNVEKIPDFALRSCKATNFINGSEYSQTKKDIFTVSPVAFSPNKSKYVDELPKESFQERPVFKLQGEEKIPAGPVRIQGDPEQKLGGAEGTQGVKSKGGGNQGGRSHGGGTLGAPTKKEENIEFSEKPQQKNKAAPQNTRGTEKIEANQESLFLATHNPPPEMLISPPLFNNFQIPLNIIPPSFTYSPKLFDENEKLEVGFQAEKIMFDFLQKTYGKELVRYEQWRSSNRLKVSQLNKDFVDDAAGYDIELFDEKEIFSKGKKTCLFEVKGFKKQYLDFNYISENEIRRAHSVSENEVFFIVFVENVEKFSASQISITILDAQFYFRSVFLEPETFRAYLPMNQIQYAQKFFPKDLTEQPESMQKPDQLPSVQRCKFGRECISGLNCSHFHSEAEVIHFKRKLKKFPAKN